MEARDGATSLSPEDASGQRMFPDGGPLDPQYGLVLQASAEPLEFRLDAEIIGLLDAADGRRNGRTASPVDG